MFINLTPHQITFFRENQFVNLEQTNPSTYVADSVEGDPVMVVPSTGVARVSSETVDAPPIDGIPCSRTVFGDIVGIPDNIGQDDILIVSLPTKAAAQAKGHPLAEQMVSPHRVVRSRSNGSLVLGAMGVAL